MIVGGRDTLQDTGLGGVIISTVMLFVFIFGFAILLALVFVCDTFKNIFPR
jgi:hypothetical protein